jgi:hypothetical protein
MAGKKKRGRMWNSLGGFSSKKSKRKTSSSGTTDIDDTTAVEKLFKEFSEEDDPTLIGMDGIVKLCEQLDLDPFEDQRVLVLLWKLGSKEKPAQINKEEFLSGCDKLGVESIEQFQALIPSLDTGFLDEAEFKDFYKVRIVHGCSVCCETCEGDVPL